MKKIYTTLLVSFLFAGFTCVNAQNPTINNIKKKPIAIKREAIVNKKRGHFAKKTATTPVNSSLIKTKKQAPLFRANSPKPSTPTANKVRLTNKVPRTTPIQKLPLKNTGSKTITKNNKSNNNLKVIGGNSVENVCIPYYNVGPYDATYDEAVSVNGIDIDGQQITYNGYADGVGYNSNTGQQNAIQFEAGGQYQLEVYGAQDDLEVFGIWIDFNQDGDYGYDEWVGEQASQGGSAIFNISVPQGVPSGNITMRIMAVYVDEYNNYGYLEPCGTYDYGETEDYFVDIITTFPPVDCGIQFYYGADNDLYVDGIFLNGLNTIGNYYDPQNPYTDMTSGGTTALQQGEEYSLVIGGPTTMGQIGGSFGAWIDYDGDGSYDSYEEAIGVSDVDQDGYGVIYFTVPPNATLGQVYLRVIAQYETPYPNPLDPCGQYSYGELEEYVVTIDPSTVQSGPCKPKFSQGPDPDLHIAGISLNGINTNNGMNPNDPQDGYWLDNTGMTTALEDGKSYELTVKGSGADYEVFSVWIDADQSGTYEEYELIAEGTPTNGIYKTFLLIDGIAQGPTSIRIVCQQDVSQGALPCGNYTYGEAEDYGVDIVPNTGGGSACTPTYQFDPAINNHIEGVKIDGVGSANNSFSGGINYNDYTSTSLTQVEKGKPHTLTVQCSSNGSELVGLWLDYNGDDIFDDANEGYEAGVASNGTVDFDLEIPANMPNGYYKLRVLSRENQPTPATTACGSYINGECEDYTLEVIDAVVSPKPVAKIEVVGNNTTGTAPFTVIFKDKSTQTPTTWAWTFPGGSPSSSAAKNPSAVTFSNVGTYTVTLTATNGAGSSSTTVIIKATNGGTPPLNDECSSATSLNVATVLNGDTKNATESQTGCSGIANDDVWYKFTPTSANPIIKVEGASGFNAVVQLFNGCGGTSIACANSTGVGGTETITATGLTANSTYYIRVYDAGSGVAANTTFKISYSYPGTFVFFNERITSTCPSPAKKASKVLGSSSTTSGTSSLAPLKICADGSTATQFIFQSSDINYLNKIGVRIKETTNISQEPTNGKIANSYVENLNPQFNNPQFIGVYKHPDWVNSSNMYVPLTVEFYNKTNNSIIFTQAIHIYRAPVVTVHGLWSEGSAFQPFKDYLVNNSGQYTKEMVFLGDYKATNSFHFNDNRNRVPTYISQHLANLANNNYSAGACDIIVHSMGGILTRIYLQSGCYRNDIHKFITFNTPHSGSQCGSLLKHGESQNHWAVKLINSSLTKLGMNTSNGAVEDLGVESMAMNDSKNGLNAAIKLANQAKVPSHVLTSTTPYINWARDIIIAGKPYQNIFAIYKPYAAAIFSIAGNAIQFHDDLYVGEQTDLIVPFTSQRGGLNRFTDFNNQMIHMGSPAHPGMMYRALQLLQDNPNNSSVFSKSGFNPPLLISNLKTVSSFDNLPPYNISNTPTGGTVKINSPANGTNYLSGDIISLNCSSTGTYTNINIVVSDGTIEGSQSSDSLTTNWDYDYKIADDYIGTLKIVAAAYDSLSSAIDTITVYVGNNTPVDSITVDPSYLYIPAGQSESVSVMGHFSDNKDRSVSDSPDLTITIIDPTIATHVSGNLIKGIKPGETTTATISYKGKSKDIIIEVGDSIIIPFDTIPPNPTSINNNYVKNAVSTSMIKQVYPNPASDAVTVEYTFKETAAVTLKVFDTRGKMVYNQPKTEYQKGTYKVQLPVNDLSPGVYYVELTTDKFNVDRKPFVVNR